MVFLIQTDLPGWQMASAMSHAIHKIVSKRRCQSYFISRRSPHHGISKDSDLCASAHRCLHYAYARLIARVTFHLQYNYIRAFHIIGEVVHFAGGETQNFGAQHRIGNVLHNTGGLSVAQCHICADRIEDDAL